VQAIECVLVQLLNGTKQLGKGRKPVREELYISQIRLGSATKAAILQRTAQFTHFQRSTVISIDGVKHGLQIRFCQKPIGKEFFELFVCDMPVICTWHVSMEMK
jgi:hypothetical protein